jgi:hypothetical protein
MDFDLLAPIFQGILSTSIIIFIFKRKKLTISSSEVDANIYLAIILCFIWILLSGTLVFSILTHLFYLDSSIFNDTITIYLIYLESSISIITIIFPVVVLLYNYTFIYRIEDKTYSLYVPKSDEEDLIEINRIVNKYCRIFSILKYPKILFSEKEMFSPFLFSSTPSTIYIVFPKDFLTYTKRISSQMLNYNEESNYLAEYVIAHELSHLYNKDYLSLGVLKHLSRVFYIHLPVLLLGNIITIILILFTEEGLRYLLLFYTVLTIPIEIVVLLLLKAISNEKEQLTDAQASLFFNKDKLKLITSSKLETGYRKSILGEYLSRISKFEILIKNRDIEGSSLTDFFNMYVYWLNYNILYKLIFKDSFGDRVENIANAKFTSISRLNLSRNMFLWLGIACSIGQVLFLFITSLIGAYLEQFEINKDFIYSVFFINPSIILFGFFSYIYVLPLCNSYYSTLDLKLFITDFIKNIKYSMMSYFGLGTIFLIISILYVIFNDISFVQNISLFFFLSVKFAVNILVSLLFAYSVTSFKTMKIEFNLRTEVITICVLCLTATLGIICLLIEYYYSVFSIRYLYYFILWMLIFSHFYYKFSEWDISGNCILIKYIKWKILFDFNEYSLVKKIIVELLLSIQAIAVLYLIPVLCILITILLMEGNEFNLNKIESLAIDLVICSVIVIYLFKNKQLSKDLDDSIVEQHIIYFSLINMLNVATVYYNRKNYLNDLKQLRIQHIKKEPTNFIEILKKQCKFIKGYYLLNRLNDLAKLNIGNSFYLAIRDMANHNGGFACINGTKPDIDSTYYALELLNNLGWLTKIDKSLHMNWLSSQISISTFCQPSNSNYSLEEVYKIVRIVKLLEVENEIINMEKTIENCNAKWLLGKRNLHQTYYYAKLLTLLDASIPKTIETLIRDFLYWEGIKICNLRIDNHPQEYYYYLSISEYLGISNHVVTDNSKTSLVKSSFWQKYFTETIIN